MNIAAIDAALASAERVTFTGYLSDPSVPMSRFDLFALSSDTEQLPIAMLEAMALGLDFTSYCVAHLPNDFVTGLREKGTPVITWTVRDEIMRAQTYNYADQMTFEGFDPRQSPAIA